MAYHRITTVAHNSTWTWLESPSGTVFRIELLVVAVAICMLFLATCGSLRRRSQSFFAQKVVLAAYLSFSLVSYTLGLMQSSPVKSYMYPFWAVSLFMLSGSLESITAYSLDDNSQQMRQIYQTTLCMFYAVLIAVTILDKGYGISVFIEIACLAGLKSMQRHWASTVAVGSWNLNKMVSDYMHHEHTKSESSSYDPVSMKGYHYLVHWPLDKSKLEAGTLYKAQVTTEADAAAHYVVDIEKIWQCERLSSEQKDTCLSHSLFHLLRRRFFGFACAESSQKKTHDFVFKGLLAKNKDGNMDYNRVFKVIEVELAFMYDFFFTKYASIHYAPLGLRMAIHMLIVTACLQVPGAAVASIGDRDTPDATTGAADLDITLVLFMSFVLLESVQLLLYSTTIWGRVYSAYEKSVRRTDEHRFVRTINHKIARMCISISNKCYWQNKLGQYSLLESVRYKDPNPSKALLRDIYMKFIRACFMLVNYETIHPFINFSVRRNVNKPGKPVKLSPEVKVALVQSLQLTQGVLTNGQLSLRSNGAEDLLWACRNGDTHPASSSICILTWHIATCYCEMATRGGEGAPFKQHIDVATKLSKYCAYLMVKEPKLLPGHHYDTIRVFDAVAEEAVVFLQTERNKYEAMEKLAESLSETPAASLPGSNEKIFHMGVTLGKQLEGMEEGARWKVLAEFWAEMLLYLAPSDNVKAHVECLAKGGELITHLWALLTHAGILDRGQRIIENAGTGQGQPAYTGEGSSCGSHSRSQAAPDTRATNQPATSSNLVQSGGTMVQQGANLVQNVEGAPSARTAPSEVEEIE